MLAGRLAGMLGCWLGEAPLLANPGVAGAADNLRTHATAQGGMGLWQARLRARDMLRVMNCVQCSACRLHGKVREGREDGRRVRRRLAARQGRRGEDEGRGRGRGGERRGASVAARASRRAVGFRFEG